MIIGSQSIGLVVMRKYITAFMAIALAAALFYLVKKNYTGYNSLVFIRNMRWQKVRIQIRTDDDPAKPVFDEYLNKGQSRAFTMHDGDNIIFRRDLDPNHPDGVHFTEWRRANCGDSAACTINDP
jgi:hypothetical protein